MRYFSLTSTKKRSKIKSKIINDSKLTKNTILTLLNKIFSTSDKEN